MKQASQNITSNDKIRGEVYPIQHYVIKYVSDLRQAVTFSGFSVFFHYAVMLRLSMN